MDRLTVERLKLLLSYDSATGLFTRLSTGSFNPNVKPGCAAGCVSHGYRYIRVDGARYAAHRLAWFCTYGMWPSCELDHVNGDKDDNRIANLREATRSQNMANTDKPATNTSGMKGVHFDHTSGRWMAYMYVDRQFKNLGRFDSFEAAAQARREAFALAFGEFAREGATVTNFKENEIG